MTPILSLYVKARMAFANHLNLMKRRDDRGAGFVEYAGVLVLVAAIATLLITYNPIGNQVKAAVITSLDQIFNTNGGGTPIPQQTP